MIIIIKSPFQVLLLAMFVACICSNIDLDDDDVDDDEEKALIADQAEW